MTKEKTGLLGFGVLKARGEDEKIRRIASMGGKAAHAKGVSHKWDSESARVAGRKGGTISRRGKGKKGKAL